MRIKKTFMAIALAGLIAAGSTGCGDKAQNSSMASEVSSVSSTNVTSENSSMPTKISDITLSKQQVKLEVGKKETLSVSILPTDAPNKSLIWSSSDTGIASVNNSGTITGVKAGKCTIIATSSADSSASASADVTVTDSKEEEIDLLKAYLQQMPKEQEKSCDGDFRIQLKLCNAFITDIGNDGHYEMLTLYKYDGYPYWELYYIDNNKVKISAYDCAKKDFLYLIEYNGGGSGSTLPHISIVKDTQTGTLCLRERLEMRRGEYKPKECYDFNITGDHGFSLDSEAHTRVFSFQKGSIKPDSTWDFSYISQEGAIPYFTINGKKVSAKIYEANLERYQDLKLLDNLYAKSTSFNMKDVIVYR